MNIPEAFHGRLKKIVPEDYYGRIIESFSRMRPVSVRINTLKTSRSGVEEVLARNKVSFRPVSWSREALILEVEGPGELDRTGLIQNGCLYIQGLSSMLAVMALGPCLGERVLDMCAAPGSKASQIAAFMENQGQLVCIENIRPRFYKLKSVLSLLGVTNAQVKLLDARRYRDDGLFDKVLLDAPCSSEGRFREYDKKTCAYWSLRKIKEMQRKQRGLALNAARLLKPEGVMVYSTCTFAPEENEAVIDWLLRKADGSLKVETCGLSADVPGYPAVTAWEGRVFDPQVVNCLRVLPTDTMEGFFIACLRKVR